MATGNVPPQSLLSEADKRRDAISGSFLAFAAMMKENYGVGRDVAVKALKLAYDLHEGTNHDKRVVDRKLRYSRKQLYSRTRKPR